MVIAKPPPPSIPSLPSDLDLGALNSAPVDQLRDADHLGGPRPQVLDHVVHGHGGGKQATLEWAAGRLQCDGVKQITLVDGVGDPGDVFGRIREAVRPVAGPDRGPVSH